MGSPYRTAPQPSDDRVTLPPRREPFERTRALVLDVVLGAFVAVELGMVINGMSAALGGAACVALISARRLQIERQRRRWEALVG